MTEVSPEKEKQYIEAYEKVGEALNELFYRFEYQSLDEQAVASALLEASMERVHELAESPEQAISVIYMYGKFVNDRINPPPNDDEGGELISLPHDPSKIH